MLADDIFSCATKLGEEECVLTVATNVVEVEWGLVREPAGFVMLAAWVAFSCHRERWSGCEVGTTFLSAPFSELTVLMHVP